jgi:hypothetical protein
MSDTRPLLDHPGVPIPAVVQLPVMRSPEGDLKSQENADYLRSLLKMQRIEPQSEPSQGAA